MGTLEDWVRWSNEDGTLILNTPTEGAPSDVVNASLNVSFSCVTDLVRGHREIGEARWCISALFSLFTLRGIELSLFPLEVRLPWETWAEIDAGDQGATDATDAASGAVAAAASANEPRFAAHVDDPSHTSTYTLYPVDIFAFFFLVLFVSLLVGVCVAGDPMYERVIAVPTSRRSPAADGKGEPTRMELRRVARAPSTKAGGGLADEAAGSAPVVGV